MDGMDGTTEPIIAVLGHPIAGNPSQLALERAFAAMKLEYLPSFANFVLVNVGDGAAVFKALLQRRIIVRALKGYHLPQWVRVSVGTMEQNRKCVAALREVLADRDRLGQPEESEAKSKDI